MTLKIKLIILFFMLTLQVSAQKLIFIPDINLRNELNKQGFVTNDSLDIGKTQGMLQLEINGEGIENLEGLQYFEQVWRLAIGGKFKRLDNLPPNLTHLYCSSNEIKLIDNLPINLEHLTCSYNKISSIKNLPPHLISLDFSNNLMHSIPLLPKTVQYINYSNNPIPLDSLSKTFRSISCDDQSQNCLPYELMNWNILNASIKDTTSLKITGMTIKLNSRHGWGEGSQVETINFKLKKSKLVANKIKVERDYGVSVYPKIKDSSYYNHVNYSVQVSKINQLLKDIYSKKMVVQIQDGDSLKSIDLKTKKNGTCPSGCIDCTGYYLEYIIYTPTDTIQLNYRFNDGLSNGPIICQTNWPENIKSILDWLYIYKLTNLTFDKHEITKYYFNKDNLDKVIEWAK